MNIPKEQVPDQWGRSMIDWFQRAHKFHLAWSHPYEGWEESKSINI